ncbi:hypothetical protein KC349_g2909 [Hortaea werneckii]|nr:hypothetical protein KC349_g2909 [Hortaea werneckii]
MALVASEASPTTAAVDLVINCVGRHFEHYSAQSPRHDRTETPQHAPGITRRSRRTVDDAAQQAANLRTSVQPSEAHHSEDHSAALRRDNSQAPPPSRDGTYLTGGTAAERSTLPTHYHSLRAPTDHQPRSDDVKALDPPQEAFVQKVDVSQGDLYSAFESILDFYSSKVEIVKTPLPELPGTLKTEIIRLSRDKNQQWPVMIRVSDYAVGNLINGVVTLPEQSSKHLVACLVRYHETRKQKWSLRLADPGEAQSSNGAQRTISQSEDLHMITQYLASMVRDGQTSSVPADRAPAHQPPGQSLSDINPSNPEQCTRGRRRQTQSHDTSDPQKRIRISSKQDGYIAPVDLYASQPAALPRQQYQYYHSVERHYAMLEKQLDDEWPHRLEDRM